MIRSSATVAYLDSVRGIAAFLVFAHHFFLAFYGSYYTLEPVQSHLGGWEIWFGKSVFSVFTNGNFWVHVFFVLSGFVLSRRYFHTGNVEAVISAFHRRFLRLYIPVAFTLIVSYLMIRGGLFYNTRAAVITHSEWWLGAMWDPSVHFDKFLSSLVYETMFQGDNFFDTSMWTISPELYGSMFVFAFLLFTHFTRYRLLLLFAAFLYFYTFHYSVYVCFVLGISLGYIEKAVEKDRIRYHLPVALITLAAALVLGSYPSHGGREGTLFAHLGHTLLEYTEWYHAAGACLLVLSFVISPALQRVVSFGIFRFIGRISYSLYLLHVLVIGSFSSWLFVMLYPVAGYHLAVLIVFASSVPLVLWLSWLMTRYVDDRAVRFARKVYERLLIRRPGLQTEQSVCPADKIHTHG